MNLFIIPSWYPSKDSPLTGIFFKEQAQLLASLHSDINIGISTWGQNDERLLLWLNKPFKNVLKLIHRRKIQLAKNELLPNCTEYFTPAFTWSKKIYNGNIAGILQANIQNYKLFKEKYGPADLVLAHVGYPAGYLGFLISKKYHIPYMVVEHMSPFPFQNYLNNDGEWMKALKDSYNNANAVIAVSQNLSKEFTNNRYYNVHVVPNYIDDTKFNLTEIESKTDQLIALTVGRTETQKGIDVLLNSTPSTNSKINFEIGGEGSQAITYKHLSVELGVQDKINWLGALNRYEVLHAIQKCDFFILPSRHESFGIVVLEALACGKPCIVTRCGGPEEIITDEVGIVVEKENPEALAEAINYMADNLDQYPAEMIRKYYEKHYSSRKITAQLRNVFEDVINGCYKSTSNY